MTALCTRCRAEPRHTGSELGERCLWPTPEERRLVAIAHLPDNWGGSEKPNEHAIGVARSLIRAMGRRGHRAPRIAPMADGGIALRYLEGERSARYDVYNEGEIVVATREASDNRTTYTEASEDDAVSMLARFLDMDGAESNYRVAVALGMIPQAGCAADADGGIRLNAEDRRLRVAAPSLTPPSITPEIAARLADEGPRASEVYFERTRGTVDQDWRTRCASLECQLEEMAARVSDVERRLDHVRGLDVAVDDALAFRPFFAPDAGQPVATIHARTRSSDPAPPTARIGHETAQAQDAGRAPKPCSHRHPDGQRWCYRPPHDDHQHEYPPARELPRGEFDKGRVRRST